MCHSFMCRSFPIEAPLGEEALARPPSSGSGPGTGAKLQGASYKNTYIGWILIQKTSKSALRPAKAGRRAALPDRHGATPENGHDPSGVDNEVEHVGAS